MIINNRIFGLIMIIKHIKIKKSTPLKSPRPPLSTSDSIKVFTPKTTPKTTFFQTSIRGLLFNNKSLPLVITNNEKTDRRNSIDKSRPQSRNNIMKKIIKCKSKSHQEKEQISFNFSKEYSSYLKDKTPSTNAPNTPSSQLIKITNDKLISLSLSIKHSQNTINQRPLPEFPVKKKNIHHYRKMHDINHFNRSYFEPDYMNHYDKNAYKIQKLYRNRDFIRFIKNDLIINHNYNGILNEIKPMSYCSNKS